MDNTTITSLPTASGIDGSVDWFAIDRTSLNTTQKINRNTMLGITGSPVGTTDSQTISNKVINNTNTVTLNDTLFTLQDNADATKQAQFQLSGITTATTRTYTLPNASSTLVDLASSQTLTNKTLTSPVITGGSIDNSTVTVDTISGHTTANTGTVYGLSVASGKISGTSITNATITYAQVSTGFAVQVVAVNASAVATGTTLIPEDDTIPQNTEGDQYMTLSITPKATTNRLLIRVKAFVSQSIAANDIIGALFQDSTANALAAADVYTNVATAPVQLIIEHDMVAGTTSATTFKFRAGPVLAATVTFNGINAARKFGGITLSTMQIIEYKV